MTINHNFVFVSGSPSSSDETRFWQKVRKGGENECWPWTGALFAGGYGSAFFGGKSHRASRVSWVIHFGPIPDGLCVLHRCDNPPCCNPAHLWLGTQAENTADRHAKGRDAKGPTHGRSTRPERTVRGDRHWTRVRPEDQPHGELHWNVKLTSDQVEEIRRRFTASERPSQRAIAAEFGVSQATVWGILHRKTRVAG